MSLRFGVDVGGTFTDVVCLRDGTLYRAKADTTHYDLRVGFFNAARTAAERAGLDLAQALHAADAIVYSTTVGTNALIERRGARLGMITTKGFEDTVKVGRARNWGDGLSTEKKYDRGRATRPEPLIPRERVVGVQERIDNLGKVVVPLRDEDVLERVQELVDQGVRGIVVVMLNAFVNPVHEQRIGALIRERYPECFLGHLPVYLSHEISPKAGEYKRAMTVIIDAYLRDLSESHLLRIAGDLRDQGYARPLFIAKNTGGLSSASRTQALHLLGSSPAATIIGADHIGAAANTRNVIISDMGGTSFDVGLVIEGRERVYEMDPVIDRFRVQIPYVAHWSIGAGGGSIARVVEGQLRVGPDSAGSNPGPACYDRGGVLATVTDADLVLGYIDPARFLGGKVKLNVALARAALDATVAQPLGISTEAAAWEVKRLIDGIMGQEMYRICALTSGQDPRDFILFAMGGAGGLHAAGYAVGADIGRVATFPFSSVFGAFSTLTLDVVQTYEKTIHLTLFEGKTGRYLTDGLPHFNEEVARLADIARRDLSEDGFDEREIRYVVDVNLSYGQQRKVVPVRLDGFVIADEADVRTVCQRFNEAFAVQFGAGAAFPQAGIELNEIRLSAVGDVDKYSLKALPESRARPVRSGTRQAYWGPEAGFIDSAVYDRDALAPGDIVSGPALCDAEDTVIVVPPGWRYRTDEFGIGWIENGAHLGAGGE